MRDGILISTAALWVALAGSATALTQQSIPVHRPVDPQGKQPSFTFSIANMTGGGPSTDHRDWEWDWDWDRDCDDDTRTSHGRGGNKGDCDIGHWPVFPWIPDFPEFPWRPGKPDPEHPSPATVPLPPAGLALLAALGGLGVMTRRPRTGSKD